MWAELDQTDVSLKLDTYVVMYLNDKDIDILLLTGISFTLIVVHVLLILNLPLKKIISKVFW